MEQDRVFLSVKGQSHPRISTRFQWHWKRRQKRRALKIFWRSWLYDDDLKVQGPSRHKGKETMLGGWGVKSNTNDNETTAGSMAMRSKMEVGICRPFMKTPCVPSVMRVSTGEEFENLPLYTKGVFWQILYQDKTFILSHYFSTCQPSIYFLLVRFNWNLYCSNGNNTVVFDLKVE